MKLVDNKGHFDFIRNGQVKIDRNLLKFKEIARLSKEKQEGGPDLSGPLLPNGEIVKADEMDTKTRGEFASVSTMTLRQYLGSEDAREFNRTFADMLSRETRYNSHSLRVIDSRNIVYAEDIYNDVEYGEPVPASDKAPVRKATLFDKVKRLFRRVKMKPIKKRDMAGAIELVFGFLHVSFGKGQECLDKIGGYLKLLKNAMDTGQEALADNLCQGIILNIYESVLSVHGFNRYITFADIEKLKSPGKREVDIDYIANFNRVIPEDVIEAKKRADSLCVFDNYAVIYYDPTGKTYDVPQRTKRDPILVGLINHSEKLYFVADWIDELCDLTLDEIASRGIEINTMED